MRPQDHDPEREDFGEWLARQLQRRGMSQSELAEQVGVTRAAVSSWVNGRAAPRMETLQDVATVLGFGPREFLTRQEQSDPLETLNWYHRPGHRDGGRELGNPATFAFETSLSVLTREAVQNSLDERLPAAGAPVRVRFVLHELTADHTRRFLDALRWSELKPHLEAAGTGSKAGRVLRTGLAELEETGTLQLLRIEDHNASGLTGPEYDDGKYAAVVRRQLDSHKVATAGGSFGLGKATLWAASRFGLVLMNSTLSEPFENRVERRMVGRLDLPWHELAGQPFAGPAWFGRRDTSREDVARSWWADEETAARLHLGRSGTAPGTSFLVVGVHDATTDDGDLETLHRGLVEGIARGFWAAMIGGERAGPLLEATVESRRDDTVVIPEERVEPDAWEPARCRAVRAFLDGSTVAEATTPDDVARTEVTLAIPPRRGQRGDPVHHEAVLLVTATSEDDRDANRIAAMRGNRMVVIDEPVRRVPPGAYRFQAVLLAGNAALAPDGSGAMAEEFLRAAEPPEHNAWKATDDLTASFKRGAASRINEFRRAISEEVRMLLRPSERATDETPAALKGLLRLDAPPRTRGLGHPTVRQTTGGIDASGRWLVHVEVRLPERTDPWIMRPVLRFLTRSGPALKVEWEHLRGVSHCSVSEPGLLIFDPGTRTANFEGLSDPASHPVASHRAQVEVVLERGGQEAQ